MVRINFESMMKEAEPVQEPPKVEPPKVEPPDVFSAISAENKAIQMFAGAKMLIREGDIAVDVGRNAMKCEHNSCRWEKNSNGIVEVPYFLSPDYSNSTKMLFLTSMQEFATLTCVRFIPQTTQWDFLNIKVDSGCWSFVGKRVGPQPIALQGSCLNQGSIQHELNHALGFYHEQSRSDRDNYVDIIWNNTIPGTQDNFMSFDTLNQGMEYDYGSVMHYPRTAFSIDPLSPTLVTKPNASIPIGQRNGLSNLDVSKINKLYNCSLCRTLLSELSGSLTSANYPSNYPSGSSCLWLIRVPSNKIFLQFNAFDVQATVGCASDYLRIYDGPTTSSPVLLDKSCGIGQVPLLMSTSNTMLLEFVSDKSAEATGFKASYSSVTCGSVMTSPTGTFSTPNYPSSYAPNTDCTWVITAPTGFQVSVQMTDFDIEHSRTCLLEWMVAYDGPKITSPLLGKYCGSINPPPITSTGNSLLIQFHSDRSIELKGFMAKYTFVPKNIKG